MADGKWRLANGRTQNTRDRSQKSGVRSEGSGVRSQKSEVGAATSHLRTLIFDVRLLCSFFLAWLIMATIPFSAVLAVEGDVLFKREGGGEAVPPAVFPHWVHRIRYKCYACHPEPFQMKAGANKITMEAIQKGEFCGGCHNGKIAWGMTFDTCNKCHVER